MARVDVVGDYVVTVQHAFNRQVRRGRVVFLPSADQV